MTEALTSQSSVESSVVIVDEDNGRKILTEGPGEARKARYLERLKTQDLAELACRRELMEIMELKSLSHEDVSSHFVWTGENHTNCIFCERKP